MALRKLHTVVAVLGIACAGAAAWWWQNRPDAPSSPAVAAKAGSGVAAAPGGGRPGGGPGAGAGAVGPSGPGGPAPVEVGKAEAIKLVDDAQAVGSLRSRQGVMLRPEVSGRVARIGFGDGQAVRRGQLLIQLDDTLQQAQLAQSQAQASIARTNLQRSRELLAQGFVSQSAVDQNAAALEVAQAQVALAQAQASRMKVLAPFDGTTGIRVVNIGDYVKDGADLVAVEDLSSMYVDFRLPERHLPALKVGLPVDAAVDALPGRSFKGRIEAVDVQVDANGRALLVRARVENPGARLKPGMFARPRVVFAVREGAVVVPEEALVPQGERQFVYKVVDAEKGQKLARRTGVEIGLRLPGRVEVTRGVAAGELVVTAGQSRLRGESTPVRVIDLARAGGTGPAPAQPPARNGTGA
jgi:membrane fusion protein (multidrug efflux system)